MTHVRQVKGRSDKHGRSEWDITHEVEGATGDTGGYIGSFLDVFEHFYRWVEIGAGIDETNFYNEDGELICTLHEASST